MPPASPTDRLAHVLVYPEQDTKAHRAVTAADLQQLLDPDYEPFAKTTKVPPLPAYGPDPYNGSAPVVLTPQASIRGPAAVYAGRALSSGQCAHQPRISRPPRRIPIPLS